eukprot:193894-Hanusia_phi.AAC.1
MPGVQYTPFNFIEIKDNAVFSQSFSAAAFSLCGGMQLFARVFNSVRYQIVRKLGIRIKNDEGLHHAEMIAKWLQQLGDTPLLGHPAFVQLKEIDPEIETCFKECMQFYNDVKNPQSEGEVDDFVRFIKEN